MQPRPVEVLLREARRRLGAAGCDQPGLDARLLLEEAAGLSHAAIAAEPERLIGSEAQQVFARLVARRAGREPVSRILGRREFYGRRFMVTPAVLDPRPDTETLIEAALAVLPAAGRLLDLGTGSGAIAITLVAERPEASGVATDISAAALAVAQRNAAALGVADRLAFAEGSWFAAVSGLFDLIVSNPPYIPAGGIAELAPDVRDFDPPAALDGGAGGLDAYRQIAAGAGRHLRPGGRIMVETGAGQHHDVAAIFAGQGYRMAGAHRDLGGHIRCLDFAPAAAVSEDNAK